MLKWHSSVMEETLSDVRAVDSEFGDLGFYFLVHIFNNYVSYGYKVRWFFFYFSSEYRMLNRCSANNV